MENGGHDLPHPPLLVRRAADLNEPHVAALLRDVPVDPAEVCELVRSRGVLVLSDVTLPPDAPPLAAAAFRVDPRARTADLIGIGVLELWRRQGMGRRLLTGVLTVLGTTRRGNSHTRVRDRDQRDGDLAAAGPVRSG